MLVPRWMIQIPLLELLVMIACMKKIAPMALPVDTTWMKMATIRMLVP